MCDLKRDDKVLNPSNQGRNCTLGNPGCSRGMAHVA
jgi:hypothetical protein